ncbi:LysR family transcriptional regulator [Maridesulfovibrio sp.]|uniref:LysR family transcriptional regulator n=1 Tax=Maridesulfovibrio sp. TaxID=2795000 RepID=UPI0029CA48DD|nr:LysR family transcriptional regulator [Maridesulfovibrio sp.]
MRIRQLRYFQAVAEELHFGKAAERLHIQQPPLSRQIQNLEEELEVQLFKRTNRKVELTDEGRYFLQEAKEVLAIMDRSKTTLQSMGNGTAGKLHVSFVYLALSSPFPDIVGDFMKKYPNVELVLHDETSQEQILGIQEGRRHVAFLTGNISDTTSLSTYTVHRTQTCAAIPANHPLAEREKLTLKDLAELPYICSREAYCQQRVKKIQKQFRAEGLELKLGMKYKRKHTGTVFIASGLGWTLTDCESRAITPDGVVLRPVDCDYSPLEVLMTWHPEHMTPLVQNFIDFYKRELRKILPETELEPS